MRTRTGRETVSNRTHERSNLYHGAGLFELISKIAVIITIDCIFKIKIKIRGNSIRQNISTSPYRSTRQRTIRTPTRRLK